MTSVLIEGGGLAGQVLHRELYLKGIASRLVEKTAFPREKVCGGCLQWDSWEYLNSIFALPKNIRIIRTIAHFWKGKQISRITLSPPMVYVSRYILDETLNQQQQTLDFDPNHAMRVLASGISSQKNKGDWLGFQGCSRPVDELEMHYGRSVYLGLSPASDTQSHMALIVKKSFFQNTEQLKNYVHDELRLDIEISKGTQSISYDFFPSRSSQELAVGDAMLATQPFLGLGMKHAIQSARLMADLIASDKTDDYHAVHKKVFRKYHLANRISGRIYDSSFQSLFRLFVGNSLLVSKTYHWLHKTHP